MGAVQAWLEAIVGLWTIGAAIMFTEPLFDAIDNMAVMFGAETNPTYVFVKNSMSYVLIPIGIAILVHAFSSSTKTEGGGYYR
ncbi:MAG: hypothetical protein KAW93_06420 [Methanogenium sp.]|nr:hypothetical protein [Methanogenium sp.]